VQHNGDMTSVEVVDRKKRGGRWILELECRAVAELPHMTFLNLPLNCQM
jgi:hypothetical protein